MSLPVQGAWIEILCTLYISAPTPPSLPVQGAWIEIRRMGFLRRGRRSLPVQGAWIEMARCGRRTRRARSLPVQGAWIEMVNTSMPSQPVIVAPRAGSVD